MSYMADEIRQAPEVIERLMTTGFQAIREAAEAIRRANPTWIAIVARGTSDHAAVYARYLIEVATGIPVVLAAPSISTVYGKGKTWRNGLLVAISQSGQSPDLLAVVENARSSRAQTVAITNARHSPLAEACHHVIDCLAGEERSIAATKTYVACLTVVAMLIQHLRPDPIDLCPLPELVSRTIDVSDAWVEESGVVDAFARSPGSLVVGRGFNLSTALEVALKLIETAHRFTIGYSAADLEHGPMALGAESTPVLVFDPPGDMAGHLSPVGLRLAASGADVWSVTANPRVGTTARALRLPIPVPDELSPIPFVIPGQLLAQGVARRLGLDPDSPRGLSKVTLTL